MDSSRTRFLLRAMRPNGADNADPTFGEALEQTRQDPELRQWLEHEQAVDRALAAKLREVRAPAELRAQILQGLAVSAQPRRAPTLQRPFALGVAALAAAASIALVIYTLLPASRPARPSFDLLVTAAVHATTQPPPRALDTSSRAEVVAWLQQEKLAVPDALPGELARQEVVGCGVAEWQKVRCSLVTMRAPSLAATGTTGTSDPALIHLYTMPRNSCSVEGLDRAPRIKAHHDATVATWRDDANYYILVAHATPASVQALLGPTAQIAQADAVQFVAVLAMIDCP